MNIVLLLLTDTANYAAVDYFMPCFPDSVFTLMKLESNLYGDQLHRNITEAFKIMLHLQQTKSDHCVRVEGLCRAANSYGPMMRGGEYTEPQPPRKEFVWQPGPMRACELRMNAVDYCTDCRKPLSASQLSSTTEERTDLTLKFAFQCGCKKKGYLSHLKKVQSSFSSEQKIGSIFANGKHQTHG